MASSWIWQQPDWPQFRWKGSDLEPLLAQARSARQELLSRLAETALPPGLAAPGEGAADGGVLISNEDFAHLPLHYAVGCTPILPGMPPFSFWEKPGPRGRIPTHRTDAGVYLTAEALGAARCVFVKDENGLYDANPKGNPQARHIPRVRADELLAMGLPDLVIHADELLAALHAKGVRIHERVRPQSQGE